MKIDERAFREILDKYLSGRASPEEKAWLDEWFEQYRREAREHSRPVTPGTRNEILRRIETKLGSRGYRMSTDRYRPKTWLAAAASIAILMMVSFALLFNKHPGEVVPREEALLKMQPAEEVIAEKTSMIERWTVKGQKLLIELPDGTTVNLNAESKLRYPQKFEGNTREIFLEGEGYFDVKHDAKKPFIVSTGLAKTIVLGTSFNIRSVAGSATEVTLVRGRVNVFALKGNDQPAPVTLHPNQQAIVDSHSTRILKHDVEVEKYIGWTTNTIYFENTTLKDVVAILGSWYNREIVLQNASLESCIINAKYRDESLENILKSLHFLLNLEHEVQDGKIILKGNGCSGGIIVN